MTLRTPDVRPGATEPGRPYHLDIAFSGRSVILQVDGPEGPKLQEHVAEVRRAAAACGLDVVVTRPES